MLTLRNFLLPAFALGGAALLSPMSLAYAKENAILFANFAQVVQDSKAGKDILAQVQKELSSLKTMQDKVNEDLKKAQETLREQKTLLSSKAYQEKEAAFQVTLRDAQAKLVNERDRINRGGQQALSIVESTLNRLLGEMLEQKGADIILNRQSLSVGRPELDLTSEVVALLDTRLPSVKVNFEKPAESGGKK